MSDAHVPERGLDKRSRGDRVTAADVREPPGLTDAIEPRPDHGEDSYQGYGRLIGQRALITGGDSGIGRAVAIAYAREGADVVISHLPEEKADANATAALIAQAGRRGATLGVDLTERRFGLDLAEFAVTELGGLDILVNNAGHQMARTQGIEDISEEQLDQVMRTNLYSVFWLTQAVVPHLSAGSCIINNSSIQAYDPTVLGVAGGRPVF